MPYRQEKRVLIQHLNTDFAAFLGRNIYSQAKTKVPSQVDQSLFNH